jgi:hypothetical protein
MERTIYNARTLNAMHQMIGVGDYFQQIRTLQVVADGKEDNAYSATCWPLAPIWSMWN